MKEDELQSILNYLLTMHEVHKSLLLTQCDFINVLVCHFGAHLQKRSCVVWQLNNQDIILLLREPLVEFVCGIGSFSLLYVKTDSHLFFSKITTTKTTKQNIVQLTCFTERL